MVSTHYTHPIDIWFHLPIEEEYRRNSPHLLIFRKKIWDTKSNSVFFPFIWSFWLVNFSKSPIRTQQFKGTCPWALFDCYLRRVNKWTLLGNLFPFSAIGLTLYYEIKRTIVRNINCNDREDLLNLEKKDSLKCESRKYTVDSFFFNIQLSSGIISKRIKIWGHSVISWMRRFWILFLQELFLFNPPDLPQFPAHNTDQYYDYWLLLCPCWMTSLLS